MERTNYVEKAKHLLMNTARTTALVIVPLAAAVSAQAGTIQLPYGNASCSTILNSGAGPTCTALDSPESAPSSGVQGLSFATSGGSTFFLSSGGGQEIVLTLEDFGMVSGGSIPGGTVIPVSYLMNLAAFSGATITSYDVDFSLGTSAGVANLGYASLSGGATSGGTVSGSGTLTVDPTIASGSSLYETVQVYVFASNSGGGGITVTVPQNTTADFENAPLASGTPEPASVGMIGAGLAMLGMMFRRRKNR
jgi:hypothetical protein